MSKWKLIQRIYAYLHPFAGKCAGILFLTLVSLSMGILSPLLTVRIIDDALAQQSVEMLLLYTLLMIAAMFLARISGFAADIISTKVTRNIFIDLRSALYRHLQLQHMQYFTDQHSSGILSRLVTDVDNMQFLLTKQFINLITSFVVVAVVMILMFTLSINLAVISLLILPLFFLTYTFLMRDVYTISKEVQENKENLLCALKEDLNSIQAVKAFSAEQHRRKIVDLHVDSVESSRMRLSIKGAIASLSASGIDIVGTLVLWLAGGFFVIQGKTTLGTLIGFSGLYKLIYNPLRSLFQSFFTIQSSLASAHRVFEILDSAPCEVEEGLRLMDIPPKMIEFNQISFRYHENQQFILNNISLCIESGTSIALVGANGSGKTSFLKLLVRLYEPTTGTIVFDGIPIQAFSLKSLRSHIGYVSQDPLFFDDTILYNITFGRSDITHKQIQSALAIAHLNDYIDSLPDGIQTPIGENGIRLSSGQKQRLAIARALVGEPWILIFDEPQANIDPESKQAIFEAVRSLKSTRTLFIVTHSLDLLKNTDKVMVFRDGDIHFGTSAQLQDMTTFRWIDRRIANLHQNDNIAGMNRYAKNIG